MSEHTTVELVTETIGADVVISEVTVVGTVPVGPAGPGVPAGGTTGQVLSKASDTDYDTGWTTPSGGGGGGGAVDSVNGETGVVVLTAAEVGADPAGSAAAAQSAAIAAAATDATTKANAAQAAAIQRSNHTGSQAISTVTGLQSALDGKASTGHASTHASAGSDPLSLAASQITSGTIDDARIPAGIARDSEVASLITAEEVARDAAISAAIATLIDTAPGALDTLNELAAALGDDPAFATTVTTLLAGKQALHANLTALSGLVGAADRVAYFTGPGALALATFTSFARSLLDDVDDAAARSTLGLVIGTHVQAFSSHLAALVTAGNSAVLAATTASFTTADESKLDGIEAGADVTDATNVAAAGAVMSTTVDDIVVLTQAAYDALSPPNATTLYFING